METRDIGAMLEMIQMAYPRYASMFEGEEKKKHLRLWQMHFKEDDPIVVRQALDYHIRTSEYPPSIAEIRKGISSLTMPSKGELWDTLMGAARKSTEEMFIYNGDSPFAERISCKYRAFDELPNILQKYASSPNGLQDLYYEYKDSPMRTKEKFMRQILSYGADIEIEEQREKLRARQAMSLADATRKLMIEGEHK